MKKKIRIIIIAFCVMMLSACSIAKPLSEKETNTQKGIDSYRISSDKKEETQSQSQEETQTEIPSEIQTESESQEAETQKEDSKQDTPKEEATSEQVTPEKNSEYTENRDYNDTVVAVPGTSYTYIKRSYPASGKTCIVEPETQKEYTSYYANISTEGIAQADAIAKGIIDSLGLNNSSLTQMQKVLLLGKWFTDYTEYDNSFTHGFSYQLLLDKTGVCSAYAAVCATVLNRVGIETYICESNQANHAWNLSKIDGTWRYYDFTGGIGSQLIGYPAHGNYATDIVVNSFDRYTYQTSSISFSTSSISKQLLYYATPYSPAEDVTGKITPTGSTSFSVEIREDVDGGYCIYTYPYD